MNDTKTPRTDAVCKAVEDEHAREPAIIGLPRCYDILKAHAQSLETELDAARKERENAEIAVETMAKRLRSCIDSRNDHERNSLRANTALAKAINALKLAYARGHYCDDVPCPGCECGHVLDEILGRTVSQEECEQFVQEQFKPKVWEE